MKTALPSGSPGMEQGQRRDCHAILLVKRDGTPRTHAHY